ncbi:MAG: winged helix DNA-binding domain-containing protein [Candidatus Symbiothrix sp.]|jgi:hypothetical protein|nr:winged helix DNA-binding domain-containing protein [Candidatus Symbiothrix sp.]
MDWKFYNTRLAAHGLANPFCKMPKEVVEHLGAIQAQDFTMAKWAIGIRTTECTEQNIEDAFNRGEILRTHVLRPTWHFVSPENIRWMLDLTAKRIQTAAASRDREMGITAELFTKTNDLIAKALESNNHLTRKQLTETLQNAGIAVDSARMNHFLMRAETEAIICSGIIQGKKQTYALLDERVAAGGRLHHATPLPTREESLAKLAKIYFTSHGPAVLHDFGWWSGLSITDARKGLESIRNEFAEATIDGQTYFFNPTIIPYNKPQVFLLPAFDEYIIAYRNRNAVITSEQNAKAISSNGIFRPTIVADGKVIGLWRKTSLKSRPLSFEYFEQPDQFTQNLVEGAAERLKKLYFCS